MGTSRQKGGGGKSKQRGTSSSVPGPFAVGLGQYLVTAPCRPPLNVLLRFFSIAANKVC